MDQASEACKQKTAHMNQVLSKEIEEKENQCELNYDWTQELPEPSQDITKKCFTCKSAEHKRKRKVWRCFNCDQEGHFSKECKKTRRSSLKKLEEQDEEEEGPGEEDEDLYYDEDSEQ